MVVDDEVASGELVSALLRSQGYGVRLLTDGRAAIELVRAGDVDLLVLDLMMAKLDGAEVCAAIRGELADLTLPIVVTTSLHDRESRLRAKEAGADDVLVKPIDGLELLVRIESLLRTRAYVASLAHQRDQLQRELADRNELLHEQQLALDAWASVRAMLQPLLALQSELLVAAARRWSHVREAREQITRFGELGAKVKAILDETREMNAESVVRALDDLEAAAASESCSKPRSAAK